MKVIALSDYLDKKQEKKDSNLYYERELMIQAVAKMIAEIRKTAKLTQAELANKVKTSQSVIARLESGADERVPSVDLLARIARASNAKLNIHFTMH